MDQVIKTENLKKHFGSVKAVDGISLSVGKGEIYGFLGLNGAGKTTTIRMLLGMIRPTAGNSFLNGVKVSPGNHKLWNHVGCLVEIPYSYPDLTLQENLEIARRMRLLHDKTVVGRVMEQLNISRYADRLAKNLSLGNQQRLGIAKAIIHEPEILLLDEPANGLDPAGIVEIRELLTDLAMNKGVTILISSHILGEIAKFATRIGIIHEGKMVQEIETIDLVSYRNRRLQINVLNKDDAKSLLEKEGYTVSDSKNGLLDVSGKDSLDNPGAINAMLVNAGFTPGMLKVEEEDLESYFLRLIGKKGIIQ